eukprot:1104175-Amphidinium_carterae.1
MQHMMQARVPCNVAGRSRAALRRNFSSSQSMPMTGVTMEGVWLGRAVIENLVRNFKLQQRDQ